MRRFCQDRYDNPKNIDMIEMEAALLLERAGRRRGCRGSHGCFRNQSSSDISRRNGNGKVRVYWNGKYGKRDHERTVKGLRAFRASFYGCIEGKTGGRDGGNRRGSCGFQRGMCKTIQIRGAGGKTSG